MKITRAQAADNWPSAVLVGVGFGGSLDHWIHLAAAHGQPGILAPLTSLCVDVGVYMSARERAIDIRSGRKRRGWVSWPTLGMFGGIILTLAGQVAGTRPTPWDITVALIPGVFLLYGISLRERRTAERDRRDKAAREAAGRAAARAARRSTPTGTPHGSPRDIPVPGPGSPGPGTPEERVTNEAVEVHFASELAAGQAPGVKRIRAAFPVGQPAAQRLRDHLREVAKQPAARQGSDAQ